MVQTQIVVKPNLWLHSKSVAEFIQKASEFKSSIWIEKDGKRANAKSMLGVLALNITESNSLLLIADGEDEEIAVKVLEEYIGSNA